MRGQVLNHFDLLRFKPDFMNGQDILKDPMDIPRLKIKFYRAGAVQEFRN